MVRYVCGDVSLAQGLRLLPQRPLDGRRVAARLPLLLSRAAASQRDHSRHQHNSRLSTHFSAELSMALPGGHTPLTHGRDVTDERRVVRRLAAKQRWTQLISVVQRGAAGRCEAPPHSSSNKLKPQMVAIPTRRHSPPPPVRQTRRFLPSSAASCLLPPRPHPPQEMLLS